MQRASAVLLAVLAIVASASPVGAQLPLAQPLAWKPIPGAGFSKATTEYTGYSTSGRIYEINRKTYNIAVNSDKPFWGGHPRLNDRIPLWPANTLLIVHVPDMIPITIDGKKVGFDQLAVGQTIHVQYSIYVGSRLGCGARAIEGWSNPPAGSGRSSRTQRQRGLPHS